LPLATLRLHLAGSGLYLKHVSLFQISPFSSRALPGTQPGARADAKQPRRTALSLCVFVIASFKIDLDVEYP